MPKADADPVSSRLDAIIRLLLEQQRREDQEITVGDQIVILESAGLQGKDVAKILGIKDVGQLPSYRRSAKKKRKGEQEGEPERSPDSTQTARSQIPNTTEKVQTKEGAPTE